MVLVLLIQNISYALNFRILGSPTFRTHEISVQSLTARFSDLLYTFRIHFITEAAMYEVYKINVHTKYSWFIVLPNLRSFKLEKCAKQYSHQDAVERNSEPKFQQQTKFATLFVERAKKRRAQVRFCMKTAEMCLSKTCVNFGSCYGNQGRRRRLKIFFVKLFHLNGQKGSRP